MGLLGSPLIGFDDTLQNAKSFSLVPFPDKVEIVSISASDIHCLALDINGYIYAWGKNSHFQISHGLRRNEDVWRPTLVKGYRRFRSDCAFELMSFVHATTWASFCINKNGKVYVWGTPFPSLESNEVSNRQLRDLVAVSPHESTKFKRVVGNRFKYGLVSYSGELFVFGVK